MIAQWSTQDREILKVTNTMAKWYRCGRRDLRSMRERVAGVDRSAYVAVGLALAVAAVPAEAQRTGEELYQTTCVACHTIGGGRLVGPDLAGVTERRDEEWLISFIQSSQAMIAAGDPVATELAREYGQLVMPDHPYSDDQVRLIVSHIESRSGDGAPPESVPAPMGAISAADSADAVRRGRDLFIGRVRLADGGPTCNSCHTVDLAGVTTGGALARDLTTAYSRLSEVGLRAVIANPPFRVMAAAMGPSPTDQETLDLVAFLRAAEVEAVSRPGRDYGRLMLLGGVGGVLGLLLLTGGVWRRRARRDVNHDVYTRQISST